MLIKMNEIEMMEIITSARKRMISAALRPFEITLTQFRLVRLVRNKGAISLSQATREMDSDRPTITHVARKCIKAGWLIRKSSSRDRRSSLLMLSGEGEEFLDSIESSKIFAPENFKDPVMVLENEEREKLRSYLEKMLIDTRNSEKGSDGARNRSFWTLQEILHL